jgi:hypothetical protein
LFLTDYGQIIGSYDPLVDDALELDMNLTIVDNTIADHNQNMNLVAFANINTGSLTLSSTQVLSIVRTGTEKPILTLIGNILNDTLSPIGSK